MDFKECIKKMLAKDVSRDASLIKSLLMASKNRMESAIRLEMSPITASSKVSLAYDSLREASEALSIGKGYKIYNHECYTAFLKEIMGESDLGDSFDSARKIRNAINYYGRELSEKEASEMVRRIAGIREKVLQLMEK